MTIKKPIYVTQPFLPPLEEFIPYLEQIWTNKMLTNDGPFHQQLERALCEHLGVEHIALFTNGTIALVTARSAPAHERAIRTLMNWNIEVDEAMFLGGLAKGEFLREFEPDFFFDDQTGHVNSAAEHVPSGHVVSGISNQEINQR